MSTLTNRQMLESKGTCTDDELDRRELVSRSMETLNTEIWRGDECLRSRHTQTDEDEFNELLGNKKRAKFSNANRVPSFEFQEAGYAFDRISIKRLIIPNKLNFDQLFILY